MTTIWYIDICDPEIAEMEAECIRDDPEAYVGANCPMLFATAAAAMEAAGVFWNDERNELLNEDDPPQTNEIAWELGQDGNWRGTHDDVLVAIVQPARIWDNLAQRRNTPEE